MSNKGITIWLILLTAWVGYQDFAMSFNVDNRRANLEKRKQIFENFDARFESLEKYINEELNPRIDQIGKYAHEHPG